MACRDNIISSCRLHDRVASPLDGSAPRMRRAFGLFLPVHRIWLENGYRESFEGRGKITKPITQQAPFPLGKVVQHAEGDGGMGAALSLSKCPPSKRRMTCSVPRHLLYDELEFQLANSSRTCVRQALLLTRKKRDTIRIFNLRAVS